jgi:hypothetical protein
MSWKKGRGKLGPLVNLLGAWRAESDSPYGRLIVTRRFTPILGGKFIELDCHWAIPEKPYAERCVFGPDAEGTLRFWSFQSDGKPSEGWRASGEDVHPEAIAFEADMPAGRARQVYWPAAEGGFHWAVESRNRKGWKRFVEHHYRAVED